MIHRTRIYRVFCAVAAMALLAGCSSPQPAPTAPPAPSATAPLPAVPTVPPTLPPAPTATAVLPTVTPPAAVTPPADATATLTPTATPGQPVVAPKATSAGKLEFVLEFKPSPPRKGDNKIQVTVVLRVKGGRPPYTVLEDNMTQTVTTSGDSVQYVRDWHNCGPAEPHTITLVSGDSQRASEAVGIPFNCPA